MKNVLNISAYNEEDVGLPTQSNFLWFRAANRKLTKLKQSKTAKIDMINSTKLINEIELKELLLGCKDVSNI